MEQTKKQPIIRNIYLYVIAAVSLFMIAFSVIDLLNIGLKTWFFPQADRAYYNPKQPPEAYCTINTSNQRICPTAEEIALRQAEDKKMQDEQRTAQKQMDLIRNISFLLVAIPLFSYHWVLIRKDRKENA